MKYIGKNWKRANTFVHCLFLNSMIKYAREQFFLSANELVDSFQRNDSKSYWSLISEIMIGTSEIYSIPSLYDNDSNELIYDDKIKENLLNTYV